MIWRPKVEWGSSSEWVAELPQRRWVPVDLSEGGQDVSAAYVPAAFLVFRQTALRVRLRFYEDEWPDVREWIRFGQLAQPLEWYPDQDEVESFTVYLHSPVIGEPLEPVRSEEYARMMELEVVIRRTDGGDLDLEWYGNDD